MSTRACQAVRVLVRDLMSCPVITVDPDEDLTVANAIMQLKHVRHLPVARAGRLLGLVTHRDLLHAKVSSTVDLSARETVALERRVLARKIMRSDILTVSPDTDAVAAAQLMLERKYGCLPVVEHDALVGILTEADLLRFFVRVLEETEKVPQ